jgi:poly(3-hydroxybutyrate) depolymerase
MGKNGAVEVVALWQFTNSANNKTLLVRWSAAPGITGAPAVGNSVVSTTASAQSLTIVQANNATNSQTAWAGNIITPYGTQVAVANTYSLDTTVDAYINLTTQLANAADTVTLAHAYAKVWPAN